MCESRRKYLVITTLIPDEAGFFVEIIVTALVKYAFLITTANTSIFGFADNFSAQSKELF
jgi:hypothetical protein